MILSPREGSCPATSPTTLLPRRQRLQAAPPGGRPLVQPHCSRQHIHQGAPLAWRWPLGYPRKRRADMWWISPDFYDERVPCKLPSAGTAMPEQLPRPEDFLIHVRKVVQMKIPPLLLTLCLLPVKGQRIVAVLGYKQTSSDGNWL